MLSIFCVVKNADVFPRYLIPSSFGSTAIKSPVYMWLQLSNDATLDFACSMFFLLYFLTSSVFVALSRSDDDLYCPACVDETAPDELNEENKLDKEKVSTRNEGNKLDKEKVSTRSDGNKLDKEKVSTRNEGNKLYKEKVSTRNDRNKLDKEKVSTRYEGTSLIRKRSVPKRSTYN